ncbi:MAG TPA: HlyD family secretion protein [Acetobacteraceae bacterium]|jgi:membrane fusion protein (multidrug efflux system)|nr:HlyD family secretion protein [Acetobacteraceae bacterium]
MSSTVLARETDAAPTSTKRPAWHAARRFGPRRLALAGVALAILTGAAWYGHEWWNNGRFIESTDDAYVGGNVTSIAPHVAGFVAEVPVTDNQHVKAGQVLIRLDQRDYQAALDHAAAVVGARLAALEALRAQYILQQSTIRQQEADLAAKSAQWEFAVQDADRYRILAQTPAGSRQDQQRTTALEHQGRSTVAAAAASLEAARQQIKVLAAQVTEAEADVAQSRSDLQTAQLNLGYTEVRSPIDGYVGNRAAQVGAYVAAGAYLISIIPSDGLWVDANFKEDQLTHMVDGDAATVAADVLPGHAFHGHVASLAPGTGAVFSVIPAENATGNFTKIVQRVPVRVMLDPGDAALRMLRPGLSTVASVDTRAERRQAP